MELNATDTAQVSLELISQILRVFDESHVSIEIMLMYLPQNILFFTWSRFSYYCFTLKLLFLISTSIPERPVNYGGYSKGQLIL